MTRLIVNMKSAFRIAVALALAFAMPGELRAQASQNVLTKMKQFFTGTPTPAPTPAKKKKTTSTKTRKHSPTPAPKSSASPGPKPAKSPKPSPEAAATPEETPDEESPSPTASAEESPGESPEPSESPSPQMKETQTSPETPTVTVRAKAGAAADATHSGLKSPVPTASPGRTAPVSIPASEIVGYDKNPPAVRRILDLALSLTTQNLGYKYGSADPAQGGMDCSGFIYYVLKQTGAGQVPRDAREQYIWVRKAKKFQAVLGKSPDTFELDDLKPGDLLFWAGTYNIDRDPAITHTMIYLGRDKATHERIMIGASDGRTYKGQSRYGVSVFDFKMAGRRAKSNGEPGPVFVGYASIPGLGEG